MSENQIDHLAQARALIDVRRYQDALASLEQHLALDPDDIDARLLEYDCHLKLNDPAAAKQVVEEILRRDPTCHGALYGLSIIESDFENNPHQARLTILRALELEPNYPGYHAHHGWCEFNLGHHEAALEAAGKALSLEPRHLNGRLCQIQALMRLGRQTEAIAAIEQALALHPETGVVHLLRALTLVKRGDEDAARQSLQEAQRLAPHRAQDFSQRVNSTIKERRGNSILAGMMTGWGLCGFGFLIICGGGGQEEALLLGGMFILIGMVVFAISGIGSMMNMVD